MSLNRRSFLAALGIASAAPKAVATVAKPGLYYAPDEFTLLDGTPLRVGATQVLPAAAFFEDLKRSRFGRYDPEGGTFSGSVIRTGE